MDSDDDGPPVRFSRRLPFALTNRSRNRSPSSVVMTPTTMDLPLLSEATTRTMMGPLPSSAATTLMMTDLPRSLAETTRTTMDLLCAPLEHFDSSQLTTSLRQPLVSQTGLHEVD